jgi:predicted HTH transcriptional regulator
MITHILLICLRQSPWVCGLILIGLRIHPGPSRPYFLREQGKKKGSFIRVGSTNRIADHPMLEKLHRTARNESYDELRMSELSSEAIDFRAASEYFAGIVVDFL